MVKKLLAILLMVNMALSLCACGSTNTSNKETDVQETEEDKIESAVETYIGLEVNWLTIGDRKLQSCRGTVTSMEKVSDTEYTVYGNVVAADVNGTAWRNEFTCTAKTRGSSWSIRDLEYVNDNWRKN